MTGQSAVPRALMGVAMGIALAVLPGACSRQGSMEKAGERADSAIEEAMQGEKDLGDGPLEQAGESADRAGDAAGDTTDGDPRTKP